MKRAYLWIFGLLIISGCSRLDTIPFTPLQTGENWLSDQPFVELEIASREFILVQPSSTVFVYFLGILAVCIGLYFFNTKENHRSRLWWGAALLFWGIGALLAGTSYQAFSYEIKCVGYEFCVWTSWWEILYMVFSVASVNSMVVALAYSNADGKMSKKMIVYALVNMGMYILVSIIGVSVPVKFLISFELMLVFLAPSILFLFILNLMRYRKLKKSIDLILAGIWLWLGFTVGAYYVYYLLGYTETLWEQGVWFSDNDVLHIGLIIWMLFIAIGLGKKLIDSEDNNQP